MRPTRTRLLAVLAVAAGVLAGCATPPAVSTIPSPTAAPAAGSSPAPTCTPDEVARATTSYAAQKASDYVTNTIRKNGFLVVGVSADTRLLGAVNPDKPDVFEGFDIDMAKYVVAAIWPNENVDDHIRYKVISAADRIPLLQKAVDPTNIPAGGVDMVARAFTVNCPRWKQGIAFSTEYLRAKQKILVAASNPAASIDKIASGSKVCAPRGSTNIDIIKTAYKQFQPVEVSQHTDCLALFQQGKVQAISGDDAILAGFQVQDKAGTKVLPTEFGDPQPYGLGLPAGHPDYVGFVNNVLDQVRADGRWKASYDKWLAGPLGASSPPQAKYGTPVGQ